MSDNNSLYSNFTRYTSHVPMTQRYIRILEGINRIFENVVQPKTEEELGNICLSVVLELTDSQYGFVGEVGHDGRLHDISISDMRWEKCLMYDKTGSRRPPGDFVLYGLYGRVIDSGKSFFTNDPQSHPYCIGLPKGHPQLSSFLGVPLTEEGKVVGILAVANREGGYISEQLEDLESIAPAVSQALKRKRAEKALHDAFEQIQSQSDELSLQSIELQLQNERFQISNMELQVQKEEMQAQSEEIQMQNEELQAQFEELGNVYETVKESEIKYNLLFENMLDGYAFCKMLFDDCGHPVDFIYLDTNSAFEKMTGLKEVKGKRATKAIPGIKESLPELFDICGRVAKTGQPERFEIDFKPLGIWLSISVYSTEREHFVAVFDDITERKQEEYRTYRYNRVLEGINRIFSNVVQAKTEEELGNTCLSVALEVTGGGIGFVNLIGDEGLMHDIAISEGGWNQCLMYDKTGHRRPPGNFIVHGLYEYVVKIGRSFFTNDPQLHPESIGFPSGHLLLTSFLAVPLIEEGKTVGMLGVGNREGGYSYEQLEDLEAVAPAVTQALKRKREEKERKQAEEALKESEAKANTLIRYAPTGIYEIDYRGPKLLSVNDAMCALSGYTREELLNMNPTALLVGESVKIFTERIKRQLAGEKISDEIDFNVRKKDGSIINVVFNIAFSKDKPYTALVIGHDVTERKKAEEVLKHSEKQYQTLGDTIPYGVWLTDAAGYCTYVSNSFLELVDMSMEQVQEFGWLHLLPPEDVQPTADHWLHCVQTGNDFEREHRFRAKDGNYRNVLAIGRPVRNVEGTITEWVGLNLDITERRKIEETLKIAHESLENKIKERTSELENAYNTLKEIETARKQEIHHRIKNNLQVISSLLDLQAEKFKGIKNIDESKVLEAFKESQDRVVSMALIHEELHKGGEIDTLNFSTYIQELADNLFLSYILGNESTSLNTDIEEDIFFDMDVAVPLGIIVNELISNSLKYAFFDRDKGEIQIKLYREENGECKSTSFVLSVSDNGVGIPEDLDIEDLDSLGLKLVNTLVDQLDGELELRRDDGTEFVIRFTVTEVNN